MAAGAAIIVALIAGGLLFASRETKAAEKKPGKPGAPPPDYTHPPIDTPPPRPPTPPGVGPEGGFIYDKVHQTPQGARFDTIDAGNILATLTTYVAQYDANEGDILIVHPTGAPVEQSNAAAFIVGLAGSGGVTWAPIGVELPSSNSYTFYVGGEFGQFYPPEGYAILSGGELTQQELSLAQQMGL